MREHEPVRGRAVRAGNPASAGLGGLLARDAEQSMAASPPAAPDVSLPKGGGAVRGIGEKFAANPATGTGSLTIPLPTTQGRSGFGPSLALAYDSGGGHGPFGLGWSIGLPAVTRKTDKGLPTYDDATESDVFILSGAEDLVPVLGADGQPRRHPRTVGGTTYEVTRYRPRVEGLYARIERWTQAATGRTHWRSISRDNITTVYGWDGESQIADRPDRPDEPDPERRVFSWLISESYDALGNAIVYRYTAENDAGVDLAAGHELHRPPAARTANRHLSSVRYGNKVSRLADPAPPRDADDGWHFELVFDYGEHTPPPEPGPEPEPGQVWPTPAATPGRTWPCRNDPSSSYRAGFEVRGYRLCQRILMFHHCPAEPDVGADCLVRSLTLAYRDDRGDGTDGHRGGPAGAFLESVTLTGYRRTGGAPGPTSYASMSLPPLELTYSVATPGSTVAELDPASLENLPTGIDLDPYQWADLDGESISGVLSEQAGAWFYKPNLGDGRFGPIRTLTTSPSSSLAQGQARLLDLAGDGQLDLVAFTGPLPGFFERANPLTDPEAPPAGAGDGWRPFRPFRSLPALNWANPDLRFIDLNGDGHADVLVVGDDDWTWYPSLGADGFGPGRRLPVARDEDAGPRLVHSDRHTAIMQADMSGDGLADLVRIRNGEVRYWPSLGHGRFGTPVVMDDSPWFDRPELFDPARLRLADVDGTGPADLVYLGGDAVTLYLNQMGNGWAPPRPLSAFPPVDDVASVSVVDLLGHGTSCLVWSSPLPGAAGRQVRYVDLMSEKPNLLVRVVNNLGAETSVSYAPSTRFYLADRAAGAPWVTRLPFPVHVVEKLETLDRVSRNRYVTRYSYHHGYFDGVEREFRGFGRVEQIDTDQIGALGDGAAPAAANEDAGRLPPVRTVSWFHTGAAAGGGRISALFAHEYFGARESPARADGGPAAWLLNDTPPPERRVGPGAGRLVPGSGASAPPETCREACRALKGRSLRQEVYALDGSDREGRPYAVTEHNYTVEVLADPDRATGRFGVFAVHPRETLTVTCERDPDNARLAHEVVLDVDPYGTVTHAVSLAYGRAASDPALPARTQATQARALVAETRTSLTAAVSTENDDGPGGAATEPDAYRVPVSYDVVTSQVSGPGFDDATARLARTWLTDALAGAPADDGGGVPPAGVTRTLVGRSLTRFAADRLDGPLPWGTNQARGLTHESYRLALSADNVTGGLGGRADAAMLRGAGYVQLADAPASPVPPEAMPDAWWAPSGTVRYTPAAIGDAPGAVLAYARARFFRPRRFVDPFAAAAAAVGGPGALYSTEVGYDDYDLVPVSVVDPVGNVVTAGPRDVAGAIVGRPRVDYRMLTPTLLTDPNGNQTAVALDALGRVAATAVRGQDGGPDATGDDLGAIAAAPELAAATVEAFWA
ncbi:SpvB/TcaC N-terminal domain-containing protein, partial [Frankia sp. Cas3]|uniref:SpvB/TcaC N-terminal domain-containing protein n=1 Tax=Frankia sp. Cas3 TaxID=3073926 RepID=UPI002AD266F1